MWWWWRYWSGRPLRRGWQPELPLDVEEYVGLASGHRVRIRSHHVGVVKVVPVAVLDDERRVVARARAEEEK